MFKGQAHPLQLRRLFHLLITLSFLSSLLLINVPTARADDVGGPIDTNTTWNLAGSPYIVVSPVLVMEGVTLTINPGVTVKFNSRKALQVDGELIASGTSENPITFTSNVGTNPGDWDYIVFSDSSTDAVYDPNGDYVSGSILKHVIIEYAGGASLLENNGTLRLDAAAPFITYTTIRNNANNGIMGFNQPTTLKMTHNTIMNNAGVGILVPDPLTVEITDSTIVGNVGNQDSNAGGGISVGGTTSLISRNIIRANSGDWGSAIQIYSGSTTISDNVITENAITYCYPCWNESVVNTGTTGEVTISNNLIAYNFTGGIVGSGTSTIIDNIIIHNEGYAISLNWYDFWHSGGGTISHNILADNTTGIDGAAIRTSGYSTLTTSYNSIVRNTALNNAAIFHEDRYETGDANVISANTIVGNVNQGAPGDLRAVSILYHPLFNDNNIYNNTGYALYNRSPQGSGSINAENNWWGTSSSSAIQALIYDWFDDSSVSIVDVSPYRTSHNLDAPVSPPTGLVVTSGLTSLSLSWAANPESDVTGYKVYYDTDGKYPYSGTGATGGASPIDVGNALSYTLTGLPEGFYHITVTAYDANADGAHDQTDGNESWLSVDKTGIVGEPLQAEFSATPTSGVAPLTVNFTNESSGVIDTCAWDFGDGGTSNNCSDPTYVYDTAGVYTVTLTINDPGGGSDELIKPDYITVNEAVNYSIKLPLILR